MGKYKIFTSVLDGIGLECLDRSWKPSLCSWTCMGLSWM